MRATAILALATLALVAAACAPLGAGREPPPPWAAPSPALPPVPFRDGPLALTLVYPPEDAEVTVRDATFVFGSTGTGRARLAINGVSVDVAPNGAFLAFLPVPRDGVYRLEASAPSASEHRGARPVSGRAPEERGARAGDASDSRYERRIAASAAPTAEPKPENVTEPFEALARAVPGAMVDAAGRAAGRGAAPSDVRAAASREQRAELIRRVRVAPAPRSPAPGDALIVESSVFPRGAWAAMPGERIEVGFRGAAGGEAALVFADGSRIPLVERGPVAEVPWGRRVFGTLPPRPEPPVAGLAEYRGFFGARRLSAPDAAVPPSRLALAAPAAAPSSEPGGAAVELRIGPMVTRVPLPLDLALIDPERPPVGIAFEPEPYPRSAGGVNAAAGPASTAHYFWENGTELTLTGERGGEYRVRLAPDLHAWVPGDRVRLAPPGTPPPRGGVGTVRLTPRPDAVDVRIEVERRLPYRIESRARSLEITLYGGVGDTRWLMSGGLDRHVVGARWSQPADGVYVLTLDLAEPHWGHATLWDANGDLVVRVRRPPPVDRHHPLRGLVVAVDPGHPPGGAIGPTGLTEAEANLAVALRLTPMIERAGARVALTRTDGRALTLYERAQIAEAAGAHLFVSLHQNAFPDGVDPFENTGTSTFYFHAHSEPLARAFQAELLRGVGLRDLGVGRASLAVLRRLTWMPAALTESLFMMVPEQEAALRDPDFQERLARVHFRAIDRYLRERARPPVPR